MRYHPSQQFLLSDVTAAKFVPFSFVLDEACQFNLSHEVVLIDGVAVTEKALLQRRPAPQRSRLPVTGPRSHCQGRPKASHALKIKLKYSVAAAQSAIARIPGIGLMAKKNNEIINLAPREASLKRRLRRHLKGIGFIKSPDGQFVVEGQGKDIVRSLHSFQRNERLEASRDFLSLRAPKLFSHFASGKDVDPEHIQPVLERISADTWQGDLFRLASLTWSVPVSNGYGRRIRYLVWDNRNGKLIGLIAIGDPVLNLRVRDQLIGWDVHDRTKRLINVMDAYVLGAVPPYNALLGGKLVACLVRSRDIYDDFARIYGSSTGIISQQEKEARLLAVTTSSSMGRSSVYNRLKLDGLEYFRSIGYTGGWGHFHIPDRLFAELRDYLRDTGHSYADLHRFGQGPNWRLRTTRAALSSLGFGGDMLRHGIQREVFLCTLASNAAHILKTGKGQPDLESLRPVKEIAELAVERWIAPRASRRPEYRTWTADNLLESFGGHGRAIREVLSKAV